MRLILENFKNHKHSGFQLEGVTAIEGENGSGKTSVLEAILFALYGRDFNGGMAVDGFLSKGCDKGSVTLELEGNSYRRVMGKESMVFFNGVKQRQSDMFSKLPRLEMAYAVVNPLYTLRASSDVLRGLLMERVELPDRVEVFKKEYSSRDDLVVRYKEGTYEEAKEMYRQLCDSLSSLEKQVELLKAELFSAESQYAQVKSERVRKPSGVVAKERERQVEIDKLNRELGALGDVVLERGKVRDRLKVIEQRVVELLDKEGLENLSELVEFYKDRYKKASVELRDLQIKVSRLETSNRELYKEDKCPLCGSDIVWEEFVKRNEAELFITKSLIEKLRPRFKEYEDQFKEVLGLKKEAEELRSTQVGLNRRASRYKNLQKKIEQLRSLQKGLSEEAFKAAVESEAQKKMLRVLKERTVRLKAKISESRVSVSQLKKDCEDARLIAEALSPKGVEAFQAAHMGKVVEGELSKYFPGKVVEVSTVRRNKSNDRYREVFEVRVNNVLWSELSFGERILIAVVMGLVLRGKDFPLNFVLLDEASVLSSNTLREVKKLLVDRGVQFIYTLAKDSSFKLVTIE